MVKLDSTSFNINTLQVNAKMRLKSIIFLTENFYYCARFGIIILDLSPVGAAVARSLDMGKVIGSIPILGIFKKATRKGGFLMCR